MQSGTILYLAQSPPPITFPALAVAILIFVEFLKKKNRFSKPKSNLDHLNNPQSDGEVQSWDDLNMVIDTSESGNSNKFRGLLSNKDGSSL